MKVFAALIACTSAVSMKNEPIVSIHGQDNSIHVQPYITPVDDSDNAKKFWNNDWEAYRNYVDDGDANNCKIYESHNWFGAQRCEHSWECRGARSCERGGFCSGWDACVATPFPQ